MNLTRGYISFLLLWISIDVFAQVFPDPQNDYFSKFVHYTSEDGLSDNRVLDIIQDKEGYVWIASENGLNKYEGHRFKSYFRGNSHSLPDNTVLDLELDESGKLWVATANGLCFYDRENDCFPLISKNEIDSLNFPDQNIRKLLADDTNNLWAETAMGYLVQLDLLTMKIKHWKHKKVDQEYYRYHALFQDSDKNIWCGGRSNGPYFFDRKEEQFHLLPIDENNPDKKREPDTGEIFEDSRKNLWISGLDGVYLFDRSTQKFSKQFGTSTYQMLEDRKQRLWLATGNGLLRYDNKENTLIHFLAHPDVNHALSNNHVHCVFEDKAGNIWAGTNEGVNLYPVQNETLKHFKHLTGIQNSLTSNEIVCAMQDTDKEIWLGTKDHGINRILPNGLKIEHLLADNTKLNSLASNRISDLYQSSDGAIWIGLWSGHGFYNYNKGLNKLTRIAQKYNARTHDWYHDFLEGNKNNVWVASWGGFGLLDCNLETLLIYPTRNEEIRKAVPSRLITCLLEANQSKLFVGTYDNGFCLYDPVNEKAEVYSDGFPDSTKLWGNLISDMQYGRFGEIWIAANGLNRFNPVSKSFDHFLSGPEFANLELNSILVDQKNILWLGTNQGIIIFNPRTNQIKRLDKSNVLPFNHFSKASLKLHNGDYLFGGKNGVIVFNPDSILNTQNLIPRPVITQINNFDLVLYHDAAVSDVFEFNHKQNDLTLHFSTLHVYGNEALQYEYKLGETRDQWFTTQVNQNIVNLSNIKPGEYKLKIRLKGATTEIAQYRLKIKPAFYQTTVFLLLVIIVGLTLLILYFRIQRNRLMAEKNAVQSEQKLLRTQMNPHFIFNSLMAIQHFLLKNDSSSAAVYLGKFSKLVRAILINSTEELIPLQKEIEFLDNYLKLQKVRFEDSFNYSFTIDKDIPLELIKIPPMLTQPFIENSIEHGIKEEGSGEVKIHIVQSGKVLKMEVEDNGIGYRAGMAKKKEMKNHESKAIKITRERLNLLHKKQKDKILFELFDLSEAGGKGTRVLFTIPLSE